MSVLAIKGGTKAVSGEPGDAFTWPIVTREDEEAVLEVLRRGAMSSLDVTRQFEAEMGQWMDMPYTLAVCNGTAGLLAAMWACGVGAGDEIICPSVTYWASALPALSLGASINFCDIDPVTLCLDPDDIEHRIGPRTKAIVVVHYCAHPADMDRIMAIARKHGVKVIEDVSHAQGGLYKGRMTGTIGDIAAMSLMSGKSFPIGEGGLVATRDKTLWERCVAFGHYERTGAATVWGGTSKGLESPDLVPFSGLPIFGVKHRINQTCSAMGRVQLKHYPARIAEIQRAMNRFWDLLEGVPGLRAHRPAASSGSTMGGWYAARGLYKAEELGGLSCQKFCEAVTAEGCATHPGGNFPLHLHSLLHQGDLFRMGKPTMVSFGQRDVRHGAGSLPVSERFRDISYSIPWFKKDRPELIAAHAQAFRKVAEHADELL
jgi:dTDP-4-amino-4,6-dideoxygalactose transaminase